MFSKAVDEYIYYYNNKRIQSKTKWMLSCTVQDNIHLSKLNIYVSRILGTHQNPCLLCLGKRNIQALKYRFYIDERVNCIREYLKLLKQIAMIYLNNQKYT